MPSPRILVVDDNPELLTLLSSSFEEAGYSVLTASRGRTALDLARKEKPALAIVDVLLPDLMGFDVGEMLKRLKIPFIFISGVHKGGAFSKGAQSCSHALSVSEVSATVFMTISPLSRRPGLLPCGAFALDICRLALGGIVAALGVLRDPPLQLPSRHADRPADPDYR